MTKFPFCRFGAGQRAQLIHGCIILTISVCLFHTLLHLKFPESRDGLAMLLLIAFSSTKDLAHHCLGRPDHAHLKVGLVIMSTTQELITDGIRSITMEQVRDDAINTSCSETRTEFLKASKFR